MSFVLADEGLTVEKLVLELLRWQIYIIKSFDQTELSCNTPRRRNTAISLETYPFLHLSRIASKTPIYSRKIT